MDMAVHNAPAVALRLKDATEGPGFGGQGGHQGLIVGLVVGGRGHS